MAPEVITPESIKSINSSLLNAAQIVWESPDKAQDIFAQQFQQLTASYGLTVIDNKYDFAIPGKLLVVDGEELLNLHREGVVIDRGQFENVSLVQTFTLVVREPRIQELGSGGKVWQPLHVAILPEDPLKAITIELEDQTFRMMDPKKIPSAVPSK